MLKKMNRFTSLVIILSLLMLITVPATSFANTTNSNTIIAKYGDYNSTVKIIEGMLAKLGYNVGAVSNWYNTTTKHAVMNFQQDNKLTVTGAVDKTTYDLLAQKTGSTSQTPATKAEETTQQPKQVTPTTDPNQNTPVNETKQTSAPVQSSPISATQPVPGLTADEQAMFDRVNQERTKAGLQPLKIDMNLVKTARMKSKDMIDNNYFAHQSPTYGSPFALMRNHGGVSYGYLGENLAAGKTVEIAMTNLMNSPTHRDNILNTNFTHIGIGIVNGGTWSKMYTQHFGGK